MEKPDDCIICLEKLDEDKPMICGHWLHLSCVKKHFKPECPICRRFLPIKVSGKIPEPNPALFLQQEEDEHNIFSEMESEMDSEIDIMDYDSDEEESWKKKGFLYPEEDEEYDEENPYGDSYDYEKY